MRTLSISLIVFSLTTTVVVSADPFPVLPFPPAPVGAFAVTVDDAAVSPLTAQGTSDPFVDAIDSLLTADPAAALPASVPCEPGLIYWESRDALGRLLKWTASDLRGTKYRAPWFQAFPWTKSFPEAGEVAGAKYRYNSMGTVGIVKSTSPWPLQYNWGPPPTDEAACVAIAHGFLQLWGDLIMIDGRMHELVVDRVTIEPDGKWSVVAGQEYQGIRVLNSRVMVNGDEFGDVFTMQSGYVPNLAVDVVPTYGEDALDRILMSSGNPQLESGGYEYTIQPELAIAHTASDPCSGTLLWRFTITSIVGDMFSYLVDAHRGEVYGYGRADAQDVDDFDVVNLRGNHERRIDVVHTATTDACEAGGLSDCHWFSTQEPNRNNFDLQAIWDGNAWYPLPNATPFWSSRKCWSNTDDCDTNGTTLGGFPYQDPPVPFPNPTWNTPTGNHFICYNTVANNDPGYPSVPQLLNPFDCWIQDESFDNPWQIFIIGGNNEYNAGKWIVDDVRDFAAYINHMETELTGVTTSPSDISLGFPSFSVLASEPRNSAIVPVAPPYYNTEEQSPFFQRASSSWSPYGKWGVNQRVAISPGRYNNSFMGPEHFASDDTIYHELGHMLWHGTFGSNYYEGNDPYVPPLLIPPFDNSACIMWQGIYRESMPDTVAALVEYYRWSEGRVMDVGDNANINADHEYEPDWHYNEGLSDGFIRDMQRPDHRGLSRRPESLNDFRFRRTADATIDYRDAEIHGASGLISRFNFLFGNDICDKDNGCGGNANELVNDPCTCGAGDANTPICYDDPALPTFPTYQRANDRFHTVMPPSSCQLNGSTDILGDPTTKGFQQYHFGVEVTSLDRTHDNGENGLERLGRLYFRMLFDNAAITYEGDEFLPYAFMDAMEDALMKDLPWAFPDPFVPLMPFYRARDAVGFWTDIGPYFKIPQSIADEGLSAAFVNLRYAAAPDVNANTEWIFGFEPSNHTIYLALRLCWNKDYDGDNDMDYCFANADWYTFTVDGPAISPSFLARSVPSVDVNDEDDGDPVTDPNHGLWIVYNAVIPTAAGDIDMICKRQVPIYPNTGLTAPRECDTNHVTDLRPGVGHYVEATIPTFKTREVIVYADAEDWGHLKSFEWGVTGSDLDIPESNACDNFSNWRPEVVNHDGYVWAFWTTKGNQGSGVCYSRLRHDIPTPEWEDPRLIPFEGQFDTCGTQSRVLNGPPEAETRNGIINLVVRDLETTNEPWVWMIQLSDQNNDGIFEECVGLEECAGDCRNCPGQPENNYEERSNWVPHTEFYTNPNSSEVGALASTEHLLNMAAPSAPTLRQDYTFFYNPQGYTDPIEKGTGIPKVDLSVWVRESW